MESKQPLKVHVIPDTSSTLNTVASGLSIASAVLEAVRTGHKVRVSLMNAERMTPSFANALVMTLMESLGAEAFHAQVSLETASAAVSDQWNAAIDRYDRGIRLTTQRPGAA